ncbi:MAG: hypothetical protein HY094_07490 [Candidatus Melainabacteria bacterium]|nr:hypothetical protein [Candidatus Melainabacteria bacterium]
MRITFNDAQSRDLGRELRANIKKFNCIDGEISIDHNVIQQLEKRFEGLSPKDQAIHFADVKWKMFGVHASQVQANVSKLAPITNFDKAPVLLGTKEGVDFIIEIHSNKHELFVQALNIDKGGVSSNIAEALRLLDLPSNLISIHGNGPIALLQENLLMSAGIDTSKLFRVNARDSYIHPCYLFSYENSETKKIEKEEYWIVQTRQPFDKETIDRLTEKIKEACKLNPKEALVLPSMQPAGASEGYFAKVVDIATESENPVLLNPKQYDDARGMFKQLFTHGKINFLKPNINEFVKFLRYVEPGIIYDSDENERQKEKELTERIGKQDFKEVIDFASQLIHQSNPDLNLIISFGKYGAIAISRKGMVYINAPSIESISSNGCSSGAGDSGLASVVAKIREANIDLRSALNEADLEKINEAFIYAASATASLPGNQIADKKRIGDLRNAFKLNPIVQKLS